MIRWGRWDEFFGPYRDYVAELAGSADAICEVGAGAGPLLPPNAAARYVATDISAAELAKAPKGYETAVIDACHEPLIVRDGFDLVFSYMVAEHIVDPASFHQNIRLMLKPGGLAVHAFPTLYAMPFLINRVTPERVTEAVVVALDPHRARGGIHEKFPAFYRWCRGPSTAQIRRFESLGYGVVQSAGFFGNAYLAKTPFQRLVNAYADVRVRHPAPHATAFAWVVLRRDQ